MLQSGDSRYHPPVVETPTPGPALLKRQLGEELRKLRLAANITVAQTAAELGSSEAKVRHLENGRNVPSKPDLTVMISLYQGTTRAHEELEELRQAAVSRGWWSSYRLPPVLQTYVGLEADATMIHNFEIEIIPGLLQTEAYARKINAGGPMKLSEEAIDRHVAARLRRQELLTDPRQVIFRSVISEAAFHRLRGTSPDIMADQCEHLVNVARRPNVTIQVLPFSAGLHPSMAGDFNLLTFPEGVSTKPAAYLEHASGGHVDHDRRVVDRLFEVYETLAAQSLSPADSVDFMAGWI